MNIEILKDLPELLKNWSIEHFSSFLKKILCEDLVEILSKILTILIKI